MHKNGPSFWVRVIQALALVWGFSCIAGMIATGYAWIGGIGSGCEYRHYTGPEQCLFVGVRAGRVRLGRIAGFRHTYGRDSENAGWMNGFTQLPDIDLVTPWTTNLVSGFLGGTVLVANIKSNQTAISAVSFPHWMLLCVLAILAIPLWAMVFRLARRRFRHARELCVGCGYSLCALTEPRCPECGTPFEMSRESEPASSKAESSQQDAAP